MPSREAQEHSPKPTQDIFAVVRKEIRQFEHAGAFQPRALPALRLYAYNFFSKHPRPTETEQGEFLKTCREVNEEESARAIESQAGSLLPTIGTEIEWFIPQERIDVLDRLESLGRKNDPRIKVVPGIDEEPEGPLKELNLPWTYSAKTQAFMIAQLAEMGMFNPAFGEGRPQQTIGMHLNFGAPPDLHYNEMTDEIVKLKIEDVNDSLTLAFTSPQRLLDRKTNSAYSSEKQTEEAKNESMRGKPGDAYRLELRALEVTQDMDEMERVLLQSQYVVSGLFQWMRWVRLLDPGLTRLDENVIDGWEGFFGRSKFPGEARLLKQNLGIANNFADGNKQAAAVLVSNPAIVQVFRVKIDETSRHIKDFIHPTDEEE